ncbi:YcnI family protein [Undibacterium sp. LX40W]|uniref:YcnI family protein n=1 Tax=Undibacterium nitidum TaxID=2762298 RepID=A0A923KNF5_9BURK|nr:MULTISPECIES: YcnI family protein [Undibacterium]MBC3880608.1 YcnI family protein [Undibacterium nitidum]MBC3890656.1 YcnI family protein [Undibacterium sp. LX40W]
MKKLICLLSLSCFSTYLSAHVGLEQPKAVAGSYHKLTFKIGHGCEGTGTHMVKVSLPETAMGAKPMPKAGWKIDTAIAPLSKPYTSHGKTIEKDVREVTWSGGLLPDAFYDEFSIQVKLTDTPGKVYFKVTQLCEKGRWDWVEIPAEGQSAKGLKAPAPVLEVVAPDSEVPHH